MEEYTINFTSKLHFTSLYFTSLHFTSLHLLFMSSSDRVHALNLRAYISQQPGKRISASAGWKLYWLDQGLDKGSFRPKAMCVKFPDLLVWTPDFSASGDGWVSCCSDAPAAVGGGSACSSLRKKASSGFSLESLSGNGLSSILSGMDLQTTVDYRNKAVSVEGKKVVSKERVVETVDSSVDVVIVVDISSSMSGEPSQEAFEAIKGLYEIFMPNDRVAIILFNESVNKVLPLTKVNQEYCNLFVY